MGSASRGGAADAIRSGMRSFMMPLVLVLSACGGDRASRVPARPYGVTDHLLEAEQHDEEARRHDAKADEVEPVAEARTPRGCGDTVLADQSTAGGERLGIQPCWTSEAATVERHRAAAERLRKHAAEHRAWARYLLEAEQASCRGLDPAEIDHSPFAHHEDIAAVTAELDSDRLRGARIRFAAVPGLTADWMRAAVTCHQARAAALGYDPQYLADDPTTVAGAAVEVLEQDGALVVVVRAPEDAAALVIYARAEALLAPE